jgi:hypothetical protein
MRLTSPGEVQVWLLRPKMKEIENPMLASIELLYPLLKPTLIAVTVLTVK